MTRRPGLTMTELLVAIFVVAIGLAGVMSMVPFGAKQMSDALVADRTATHAATIDGMVRTMWKERIVEDKSGNGSGERFWRAMDNPADGVSPPRSGVPASLTPADTTPSFPVFVDPLGSARGDPSDEWVGDNGETFVPRRSLSLFSPPVMSINNAVRAWSQADGFSWDEDSRPSANTAERREFRYNALAVIQRSTNSQRNNAMFKIVVFSNRRPFFFPSGSEAVTTVNGFTPGLTNIQLPTTADVRKGSWIMDATVVGTIRHANFYRIVSAVDNGAGVYDIELHTPIKRTDGNNDPILHKYDATIVVMPGVAGVFERPPLTDSFGP